MTCKKTAICCKSKDILSNFLRLLDYELHSQQLFTDRQASHIWYYKKRELLLNNCTAIKADADVSCRKRTSLKVLPHLRTKQTGTNFILKNETANKMSKITASFHVCKSVSWCYQDIHHNQKGE